MRIKGLLSTVGALALSAAPMAASAETLRVGLASEPTAADPHYHELGPNNALARHIFDALLKTDAEQQVEPSLAESYETEDDNTWVFHLRDDVTFSDGSPFTADDVIFTFCRVMNNETSVTGSFTNVIENMTAVEKRDDHTLVIRTERPDPLLPNYVSSIGILPASLVEYDELTFAPDEGCGVTSEWPTVSRFNDGSAAIGTGPFKLESYTSGSVVHLTRNENYWGEASPWSEVRFFPVPNAGPRLAGLLSGDYDLIENVSPRDLARIEQAPNLDYITTPSTRVIYLQLDMRDEPPFIEAGGANPFQDVRVRRAVSMAIDRQAIVDRIMDGAAEPAYQFLPTGMFGTLENPPVIEYDPEGARALLAEAGYPDGFQVTFHATNDRYINDGQIAQVVAQFLTQVGIRTNLDAMTASMYFGRRAQREFSLSMGGWGSTTGEASSFLRQWVATTNPDLGVGGSNYGDWSDPEFDELILAAIGTIDEEEREDLLRRAGERNLEETPYIPLHFESSIWAFRDGLTYEGRADQWTLATSVSQQ